MKEMLIEGKYATAKVFTVDNEEHAIDPHAVAQIKMICDDEISKDAKIRVMPDVHAGKVGPIGLTMKLTHDRIIPNLIGPDIGCGISVTKLDVKKKNLTASDFEKLDRVIRENITSGSRRHGDDKHFNLEVFSILNGLFVKIDTEKVKRSLCTLGGGNHFIEIDQDEEGNYYLVIHTGSRSLGPIINTYYNNEGQKALKEVSQIAAVLFCGIGGIQRLGISAKIQVKSARLPGKRPRTGLCRSGSAPGTPQQQKHRQQHRPCFFHTHSTIPVRLARPGAALRPAAGQIILFSVFSAPLLHTGGACRVPRRAHSLIKNIPQLFYLKFSSAKRGNLQISSQITKKLKSIKSS